MYKTHTSIIQIFIYSIISTLFGLSHDARDRFTMSGGS